MKQIFKKLSLMVVSFGILLLAITTIINATQTTKSATYPSIAGFGGVTKWNHTFAATGADTLLCNYILPNSLDSIVVLLRSTSASGDSVGIEVDFQQSMDNSVWLTNASAIRDTTVGINTHTDPKFTALNISFTRGYTLMPYNRFRVRAIAINDAGTVIDLYAIQYKHGIK